MKKVLLIVFGSGLLLLDTWLYVQSQVDFSADRNIEQKIKQIYRTQDDFSAAIFSVRSALYPNYDGLNRRMGELAQGVADFNESLAGHITDDLDLADELRHASGALAESVTDRQESLYDFFEANSLLRNSQTFLITILGRDDSQALPARELLHTLLRFMSESNTLPAERIERYRQHLRGMAADGHAHDRQTLDILTGHLDIVIDETVRLRNVETMIANDGLIPHVDGIDAALKRHYAVVLEQADTYRQWSYLLSIALLMTGVAGIARVWQTSRALALSNKALLNQVVQREKTQETLLNERERILVTLESIGDGVITTDTSGIVDFMNPVAEELTGWTTDEARGRPLPDIFTIVNEFTRQPVENPVERCLFTHAESRVATHTLLISRGGREVAIEDSAAPIRDSEGNALGVVLVFHDVTQARKLAAKLNHQATHDALSGLINRVEFERRLEQAVENTVERDSHHALLYVDLDRFKIVNDTCGHIAGDELLRQVALLLPQPLRESDTLARLGGDEFGVLLENCPLDKAVEIAEEMRAVLLEFRFAWQGHPFSVGASIGVAAITQDSGSVDQVMSAADMACYAAKDMGRQRIHVARDDDARLTSYRSEMRWVHTLQAALESGSFEMYYQRIAMRNGGPEDCSGIEVLLRLREGSDVVFPGSFIFVAERHGLMPAVDRWVIRHVFENLNSVIRQVGGDGETVCFINISGASLGEQELEAYITGLQQRCGVRPQQVCFEITETVAIANLTSASRFIKQMKAAGFSFALDDFGCGLSSFAYLKNLPVDYLKVDGIFVRGLAEDPIDQAMVVSINQISHAMNLKTVAECVESQAILVRLEEIGVDFVQGYHIHRPEPLPVDVGLATGRSGYPGYDAPVCRVE